MGNESSGKFTWVIKNFCSLQSKKIYSDEFVVGGCKWRLKAFPKGDSDNDADGNLSLYLTVANAEYLQFGWRRHAKFSFTVVNQFSKNLSLVKVTDLWFDESASDRGYPAMINFGKLVSEIGGFMVDGEVKIVVEVEVHNVIGELDVPVNQSIDVNGFHVLPSQVDCVKRIFEKYPDVASEVRTKNPRLKTAYMNVLLSLTEVLHRAPQEISNDDLADAYDSLRPMKYAGFKLDWLEKKLNEVAEKKKKDEDCEARIRETEQELIYWKAKALAALELL